MNEARADWHELGRRHAAAGRHAAAHACLNHALARAPDDDAIRADLARALYFGGRADEALPLFRDLVARQPDNPIHVIDLGRALRSVGAYAEAIATYRPALGRLSNDAIVLNNIGNCELELGRTEAAVATLRAAVAADPAFADAHYNLGMALLANGDMRQGWEEYRWRLRMPWHLVDGEPLAEWDGAPMPDKVLLVRPEQGLGDTIQFCRYASLIAPRAQVVLGVPKELFRLTRDLPGIAQVITEGDPTPARDAECLLMSLPRLLGAVSPADAGALPYLRADPAAVSAWRARLADLPGPRIGLVWAGSPSFGAVNLADRRRSIPLAAFAPLRGATFVSLQKGPAAVQARQPPAGMALIDPSEDLHDLADTAALIAALDLVISVDTSVAHLAGALGRPVWMLNRADSDWRWGFAGETTPWYPTMRIFRQREPGDWTAPIEAVAAALHAPPSVRTTLALAAAAAPDEAVTRLREALADHPDDPDRAALHAALAEKLLLAERWAEAWPAWQAARVDTNWPTPEWDGTPIPGETLLLHAETIADVLLFGRYVSAATRRSEARVVLSMPEALHRLMLGWNNVAVATAPRPTHHRHRAFALLPVLFRARPDNLPDTDLCPLPSAALSAAWLPRLAGLPGRHVGVALADVAWLTATRDMQGGNFVPLNEWSDAFDARPDRTIAEDNEIAALAGLLMRLDLIVAEANGVALLAAALGRPVWLIGPDRPRFPWPPGREDNPWFPTLRQFPAHGWAALRTSLTAFATAAAPEDYFFDHANDCYRRKDYRAAASSFRQTLALRPDHPGALGNLSITMLILGRPEIALRYAEHGARVAPESQPLRFRLGLALHASGRFDAAVARLREARAMQPDHGDTVTALGNALGAAGALPQAIATLREAVALRPNDARCHTNLGYALLRAGQWAEGWREHEHRPERPRVANPWDGKPLDGRPLLLRHEQGIGDIIQFSRFAGMAAARCGGPVYLTAPPSLRDPLRSLSGVTILTAEDQPPADAAQFPLLSLPWLFGITPETLPFAPYLHADPSRVAYWRDRLAGVLGLRVGLAWSGNPRLGAASLAATDRRRSLPEHALAPLAAIAGVSFVSLQVGDAVPPGVPLLDCSGELTDFGETAALIMALDLVISVDTAVAHLAGALGQPIWLLNRFDTDWRWMDGRDDSPWYPTLRQFRQTSPGDWPGVIARVAEALVARPR